jgi:hypothetical protein
MPALRLRRPLLLQCLLLLLCWGSRQSAATALSAIEVEAATLEAINSEYKKLDIAI